LHRGLGQRVKVRAAHAQLTGAGDGVAKYPGGGGSGVGVLGRGLSGDLGDHAVGYGDPAQFGAAGQRCGPGLGYRCRPGLGFGRGPGHGYGGHLLRLRDSHHACASISPAMTLAAP